MGKKLDEKSLQNFLNKIQAFLRKQESGEENRKTWGSLPGLVCKAVTCFRGGAPPLRVSSGLASRTTNLKGLVHVWNFASALQVTLSSN